MSVPSDEAAPSGGLRNVKLTVAYDGTDLHGFSESPGVRTVMGVLRVNVERIVQRPVDLVGAGRTDAGVHAWGQVVSGEIPASTDLDRLAHGLNRLCAPAIAVREASWADAGFSARFSATARTYRYRLWNDRVPNPLVARHAWHVAGVLDLGAMNRAAAALVGEHDFSSFCRRPKVGADQPVASMVRRVVSARWQATTGAMCEFEVTATAFCHQMVRSVVGTLVEVGLRRRDVESITATLEARDRSAAGRVAPPHGLVLWAVDYSGERWDA